MKISDRPNLPAVASPIVHCVKEGGVWRLGSDSQAPIRVYSNGLIEDDIWANVFSKETKQRGFFSPPRLLMIIAAAYKLRGEWGSQKVNRFGNNESK